MSPRNQKTKPIFSDSFLGKLVLNGIDKLVFTLLLLMAFAFWNSQQQDAERQRMRAEDVRSITIQRPIGLMEELAEPVRQCVLFVRRKQTAGINSPDDKGHFESLILEIEFHLNLISSYSKGRTQTTASVQSLREIVRQFNTHIQTRKVTLREYTNFTESLYEGLVQLSDHTIEETKIAILSDPLFSGRHPDTTE